MKLIRFIYLCCLGLLLMPAAYAQVDSTAVDPVSQDSMLKLRPANVIEADTLESILLDSLLQLRPDTTAAIDTTAADSLKPIFKVVPWKYHAPLGSRLVSTDSTLRWQVWPGWTYKKNRDPGVISFRMGTTGRTNTLLIYAHEPRHQQLLWEDVSMNDPVSGALNWSLIPLHKLSNFYEEDRGISYVSNFFLKQYYLNQPLSQLIYRESKFNTRSLEFMVSQNFNQKTNAEISYWYRRDGGEYPNSDVAGQQIFARVFHQLDHRQALKIHFLNNNYTIGQPFGYGIPDLSRYAFNRFFASASQSSAESELSASNFSINYYRRGEDTTNVTADDFHAGLFFNSRKRALDYLIDSTYYKVQSVGINAHKWLDLGPLKMEGSFSDELFFNRGRNRSNLFSGNWNLLKGEAEAVFRPFPLLEINGGAGFQNRSDGFNSYSLSLGSQIHLGEFIRIAAGVSKGTIMPTPQQLYWSSDEYQGSPDLAGEQIKEAHGEVSLNLIKNLNIGIRGQLKDIENGIMVDQDSSVFINIAPYNSVSASAYFNYNSKFFELSGSATYHRFGHFPESQAAPLPMNGSARVWLKGGAYIKGYLFSRATYVKAGVSGMMSPFRYQAAHYNPVLDFWQPVSDDQLLPVFNRLDVDISARIRTIMITLRWENVLDDISQLGYFETAQYPMGQRRLIFGIKAFFRN